MAKKAVSRKDKLNDRVSYMVGVSDAGEPIFVTHQIRIG